MDDKSGELAWTLVGGMTEGTPGVDVGGPLVRLRHEAGLTAGRAMPLRTGAFQFGPLLNDVDGLGTGVPDTVSFELVVEKDHRIVARRGTEPLALEGVAVTDPVVVVPGDVIQLATDHFTVEHIENGLTTDVDASPIEPRISIMTARRPPVSDRRRWFLFWAATTAVGFGLAIADTRFVALAAVGLAGVAGTWILRRRQRSHAQRQHQLRSVEAAAILSRDLQIERAAAARALRSSVPGPAAVTDRIASDVRPTDVFDGRLALAAGDVSWAPPLEENDDPGWDINPIIDRYNFLPAVPFVVDVNDGPIGIVGPRRATVAVARHLLTAAMAQTTPTQLTITTMVEPSRALDWAWIKSAPHHQTAPLVTSDGTDLALCLVDGSKTDRRGPGTIVIADTADELQVPCFTVLTIADDGTASALFGDGAAATGLVPNGITTHHAETLVEVMTAAQGQQVRPLMAELDLETDSRTDLDAGLGTDHQLIIDLRDIPAAPTTSAPGAPELIDLTLVPSSYAFLADELVVIGEPTPETLSYVASSALEQAAIFPDRSLYILDRGDRALIRLAQLPTCARYTPIDDLGGTIDLVAALETVDPDPQAPGALLVAPDLGPTLDFYRRTGAGSIADRFEQLLDGSASIRLATQAPAAGDRSSTESGRFFVWIIAGDPHGTDGDAVSAAEVRIVDQDGEHRMDLSNVPGRDLTAAVADIKHRRSHVRAGRVST